jgi:hypothetical protein
MIPTFLNPKNQILLKSSPHPRHNRSLDGFQNFPRINQDRRPSYAAPHVFGTRDFLTMIVRAITVVRYGSICRN